MVGRGKVANSPSVQGPQFSEEEPFVRCRFLIMTERLSVKDYSTNRKYALVGQAKTYSSSANGQ